MGRMVSRVVGQINTVRQTAEGDEKLILTSMLVVAAVSFIGACVLMVSLNLTA